MSTYGYNDSPRARAANAEDEMRAALGQGGTIILSVTHSPRGASSVTSLSTIDCTVPFGCCNAVLEALVHDFPFARICVRADRDDAIDVSCDDVGSHAAESIVLQAILAAQEAMADIAARPKPIPPTADDTQSTFHQAGRSIVTHRQSTEKRDTIMATETVSTTAVKSLVSSLSREQCLAYLSDESISVDLLRAALLLCLTGGESVVSGTGNGTAPKPNGKPAKAATVATSDGEGSLAEQAVAACIAAGGGFAVSDVIAATEGKVSPAQASRALKKALQERKCFTFGERRFARYGKTEAAAKKRSLEDRAGTK